MAKTGFDVNACPLSALIEEIEDYCQRQLNLGVDRPGYVTVDSTPGAPADPAEPEGVYPIVEQFDVNVPTNGFVYDKLKLVGSSDRPHHR